MRLSHCAPARSHSNELVFGHPSISHLKTDNPIRRPATHHNRVEQFLAIDEIYQGYISILIFKQMLRCSPPRRVVNMRGASEKPSSFVTRRREPENIS